MTAGPSPRSTPRAVRLPTFQDLPFVGFPDTSCHGRVAHRLSTQGDLREHPDTACHGKRPGARSCCDFTRVDDTAFVLTADCREQGEGPGVTFQAVSTRAGPTGLGASCGAVMVELMPAGPQG